MQERFGGSDGKQVMMTLNQALAYFPHACAEALLKAASQLAVLDEEPRTDQVRFFHQLLQESFAARQLATQPAPVAELARSEWRPIASGPRSPTSSRRCRTSSRCPLPDPTGWDVIATGEAPEQILAALPPGRRARRQIGFSRFERVRQVAGDELEDARRIEQADADGTEIERQGVGVVQFAAGDHGGKRSARAERP